MVDLKELYAKAGFMLAVNELPDYLPMVLEYLSLAADAEAHDMLGDCAHIVRAVGEALPDRDSDYARRRRRGSRPWWASRASLRAAATQAGRDRARSTTNGSTSR